MTARLCPVVLALAILSAGCAGSNQGHTTTTPTHSTESPGVYVFNRSESFQVDRWAEQTLTGNPELFLVGSPLDPVTGAAAAGSHIMPVAADLSGLQHIVGPVGTRGGDVGDVFAAQGPDQAYLAFDARPSGVENQLLEGWTTWATYASGKWQVEEAPDRWAQRDLEGLVFFDGAPRVLMRGPLAYELWTLREGWTSEILPDLNPVFGWPAMAANATTLIIADIDRAGEAAIWERSAGEAVVFRRHTLHPGGGGGGFFAVSALPGAAPAVAWSMHGLAAPAGLQTLTTYLGTRGPQGWILHPPGIPDTAGPPQVVATPHATFLHTETTGGKSQTHWWDESAWQTCGFEGATNPRLLAIGDEAFQAYVYFSRNVSGSGVVRLTTATLSCLPGGMESVPGPSSD